MRRRALLLAAACLACTGPSPTTPSATGGAGSLVDAVPKPAASIRGEWRMIHEEAAKPGGYIYEQGRRLLTLEGEGEDQGHFVVQNYIEQVEGRWTREGSTLLLGEVEVEVVSVEAERLITIEAVPEIYLRGGDPQQAKITYRRVSERELGPMLGTTLEQHAPGAGRYVAAYAYSMDKLPTMEITIDKSIQGTATLELREDGQAQACLGAVIGSGSSISKYASDDGRHHRERDERRWLLGFSGRWVVEGEETVIRAEHRWWNSCAAPAEPGLGQFELRCTGIAANDALPRDAIACRIEGAHELEALALNPADTERSGPYTLQSDPMGHISTDQGRPWLVLGAAPGLKVVSEDGRRMETPEVRFEAAEVELDERRYQREPNPL